MTHNKRGWGLVVVLTASFLTQVLGTGGGLASVEAAPVNGAWRVDGTRLVDESGKPVFLLGVNYEGHTDRAWQLWEDGKFDAGLIDRDLAQAERAGLNVVRVFVQKPLRDNIEAGNWSKLDKVAELARQHGLRLLLTFNDYDEPNLAREADFDRKVAAHYAANPTFLGYDLKNEPQFGDLATADYPAAQTPPLQQDGFIQTYGQRMTNDEVKAWRLTQAGKNIIPARFDDRRAYLYANAYRLWVEFLAGGSAWVATHPGQTTLDYINSPDSNTWRAYLDALSGTVGKYIEVRQGAIRAAQPGALTTIGWSNSVLAKMGANNGLSFVSLHRFTGEGIGGLNVTIGLLENLRASFPARPVVLEEFGYSNARDNGTAVDPPLTANHETALWLYLYSKGYAGGFKWMLTNFPSGFNKVQNNYGLLDDTSGPKPAYHALRGVAALARAQLYGAGTNNFQLSAAGADVQYRFSGPTFFGGNAQSEAVSNVLTFSQPSPAPFVTWWGAGGVTEINFVAAQSGTVRVRPSAVYPQRPREKPVKLLADGVVVQQQVVDDQFEFVAAPGVRYSLAVPNTPTAFNRANPLPGATFFAETGHNLGAGFRAYWQAHGGLAINGFPISEEFAERNLTDDKIYTVQYFERSRFEYHPELAGTKYEVLLGQLGRLLTSGREGEPPFQRIAAFPNNRDRLYFPETGHSLSFGFRGYWERNGGLAQFGYPITEEFAERNPTDGKTYTVQYFERARFEFHPELQYTPYEVLLGLLGWQLARANS